MAVSLQGHFMVESWVSSPRLPLQHLPVDALRRGQHPGLPASRGFRVDADVGLWSQVPPVDFALHPPLCGAPCSPARCFLFYKDHLQQWDLTWGSHWAVVGRCPCIPGYTMNCWVARAVSILTRGGRRYRKCGGVRWQP